MPGAPRESAASICHAAGFVLAGGQSSRMGRDKALLPFAADPLIAHALSTLREAGLPVAIAGAASSARTPLAAHAPVVDDPQPGLGPLAGICAAFAATSARFAVFLPVDLPLLPASLIAYLLHHARITGHAITVPSVNGFIQTFPAVLERSALPALQNELHSGQRGCFSAFRAAADGLGQPIARLAIELLAQSGQVSHPLGLPPFRWFLNVNTPQDLHRAEQLIAHAIA
ncbi:MAG: molybdenum cofactor guanylyltransferase [Terracidiphilus sp.]|jgi:molybdopterin-guanine dinucleotide biosynthesis protein A